MGTDCSYGSATALASVLALSVASWKGYRAVSNWWAEGKENPSGWDDTDLINEAGETTSAPQGHTQILEEQNRGYEESKSGVGIDPSIVVNEPDQYQTDDDAKLSGDAVDDTSSLVAPDPDGYSENNEHAQTIGQEDISYSESEVEDAQVATDEGTISRESVIEESKGDSDQEYDADSEDVYPDSAGESDDELADDESSPTKIWNDMIARS